MGRTAGCRRASSVQHSRYAFDHFGASKRIRNSISIVLTLLPIGYSLIDDILQDPKKLRENTLMMTATLVACGVDFKKSILFQQSKVSMHAELCWILGSITTMARLAHLPQFKEKSESLKNIPLGLYIYPILQAADILLYK